MTSSIQSAYDKWSATYDTQENPTRDLDKAILQSRLIDITGLTVVEVGCGTGKNTQWIAPQCQQVYALDFSSGMMALAQAKVQSTNVSFIRANILNPLPLQSDIADVVIINLVLEHIEDLPHVMHEVHRVMRSGARLIISEFHPQRMAVGEGAIIAEDEHFVGTFAHTVDDFRQAINAAGFTNITSDDWWWAKSPRGSGKPPLIITFEAMKA